jgi:hypothetical protein
MVAIRTRTSTTDGLTRTESSSKRRSAPTTIGILLVALAATAGCGDDDNESAAACDAWVDVERAINVDEDLAAAIDALDAFVDAAPDDVADDVDPIIEMLRDDPAAAFESPELTTAESAGDDYVFDNCGDTVVEVEAVNFAYSGVPDTIDAGRVVFELTNHSATGEFHEALLLRNDDSTTTSHDVLAAGLTDPITAANTFEAIAPFTIVAISIVEPDGGDTADVLAADLTPGDYIIACLLPVDSPELLEQYFNGDEVAGHRHFDEGMFAEFTVAADS